MCQVIQISDHIPRKPTDRDDWTVRAMGKAWNDIVDRMQTYRCTGCHREITLNERVDYAVYCDGKIKGGPISGAWCGAEMRPVEAK